MSLLRRIEQGQGGSSTPSPEQGSGGQSGGGGGENSSRLSSLQARRVSAPITSPQAGSYFDLKTRVCFRLSVFQRSRQLKIHSLHSGRWNGWIWTRMSMSIT